MDGLSKADVDAISYKVVGAAIEVHKMLGPGLLENVYHQCMKRELSLVGLEFVSEFLFPLNYKGIGLDAELRCDFLVEGCVAVELKAVENVAPVFDAQTLTYMMLLEVPKGILINFTCTNIFKEGQRTFVNELHRK